MSKCLYLKTKTTSVALHLEVFYRTTQITERFLLRDVQNIMDTIYIQC